MKLNFKQFKLYTGISKRDYQVTDASEQVADLIYKTSSGIAALELARKIYNSEGEVDLTDKELDIVRSVSQYCIPQFIDSLNDMIETFKE